MLENQQDFEASFNPLASWTFSPGTAEDFTHYNGLTDKVGVVLSTEMPVENILSFPYFGLGALNEYELVVIGRDLSVKIDSNEIGSFFSTGRFGDDKFGPSEARLKAIKQLLTRFSIEDIRNGLANYLASDPIFGPALLSIFETYHLYMSPTLRNTINSINEPRQS